MDAGSKSRSISVTCGCSNYRIWSSLGGGVGGVAASTTVPLVLNGVARTFLLYGASI